ncbi:MAG: hypothetical protein Q4P36_08545 [Bowdeniella nasicola]|nr:hypothetical protein [Bowdeniella nasicola]
MTERSEGHSTPQRRASRPLWARVLAAICGLIGLALIWTVASAHVMAGRGPEASDGIYASHRAVVFAGPDAWRSPYNRGTLAAEREDYAAAVMHLERALTSVPKATPAASGSIQGSTECRVRTNLSLALEGLALETAEEAGVEASGELLGSTIDAQRLDQAIGFMDRAAEASKPCTTDGEGGESSTADEDVTHQRQQRQVDVLRTAAEESQDPGEDATDEPEADQSDDSGADSDQENDASEEPGEEPAEPTPTPTLDDKQAQLEENQRQAEEVLQQREGREGAGFGTGEAW